MIRRHRREGEREGGREGGRERKRGKKWGGIQGKRGVGGGKGGDCVYPLVTSDVIYSFAELILMLIVMFC